ncbi:hypothetical protein D3C73_573540 [compost metagenome]
MNLRHSPTFFRYILGADPQHKKTAPAVGGSHKCVQEYGRMDTTPLQFIHSPLSYAGFNQIRFKGSERNVRLSLAAPLGTIPLFSC